jgi:uncharacterized protein (TIGR00375 family)
MEVIADLHLHSKYSRAVSPQMTVPQIALWAAKKGIDLVGTGDFTHPLWLRELKENLKEVEQGVFGLKDSSSPTLFLLSVEIASIYSQNGHSHRIHNVVLAPSLAVVEEINTKLRNRGVNLFSDGRPITGLSSLQICDLVFSVSSECLLIPAHIWTPWYSLYGANSGFDSLKECFGDFSSQILAVETGLSSDPAMNWRVAELDQKSIVSFSDAHSPAKLGREATVFDLNKDKKINYPALKEALTKQDIAYTIEFYPEEGKYHWTGHRDCHIKQSPEQTVKMGTICPVCGKKLTVGVMHRVEQLSSRSVEEVVGEKDHLIKSKSGRPPYFMIVPLLEVLAEATGSSSSSQTVISLYEQMITKFGSEMEILLKTPIEFLSQSFGERTGQAIERVRQGQIFVDPGFDGVFGTVKIWGQEEEKEKTEKKEQMALF